MRMSTPYGGLPPAAPGGRGTHARSDGARASLALDDPCGPASTVSRDGESPDPLSAEFAVGADAQQIRRAVAHAASDAAARQRVYRTVQTQAIRALLEIHPVHPVRHIAAALGMSKSAVARELQTLADDPDPIEPCTSTDAVRDAWGGGVSP
jgi:hypothetical protein